MGFDNDGPSDEEASASQPSYRYQSQSPRNRYNDYDVPSTLSPPPPPKSIHPSPPPPPPTSPPQDPKRQSSRNKIKDQSSSRYPAIIQVNFPRSRSDSRRVNQKLQNDDYSESDPSAVYERDAEGPKNTTIGRDGIVDDDYNDGQGDEEDYDDAEYDEHEEDGYDAADGRGFVEEKYESFNAPSVNNSFFDNSMDESHQRSSHLRRRGDLPNPKKASQVLVHYHPQLGDTGYESTLIDQTASPSEHSYARVSRAMNIATRRELDRPPKHIYPTSRGMHARMIDDARVEEEMNYSPKTGRAPFSSSSTYEEGNDEYNNAATRQIRRRVFRVAMERGIRYERRKKLLDADADVGGPSQNYESTNYTNGNGNGNGYLKSAPTPIHSTANDENDGDMLLTPGRLTTPKTITDEHSIGQITSTESLRSYVSQAPPSPPRYPPSYKTLVYNLISANEPDKLVQIDRVMEKYVGREEELIKKLDLRYRRQRIKRILNKSETGVVSGGETKKTGKEESSELHQQPILKSKTPMMDDGVASMIIQTVVMTPPKKLTFVKVDPPPNKFQHEGENTVQQNLDAASIGAGDRFDSGKDEKEFAQDEIMIQPKNRQGTMLSRAISESTKTQVHTNASGEMDDDDNSGMIPITPKLMKNVIDLGNQVVNERLQREREELLNNENKRDEVHDAPIVSESSPKLETISGDSLSIPEPYKLTKQLSYNDGISVITMETKSTLQNRMIPHGGERETLFSFEDMKRPPSSITVESVGSGSKGEEKSASHQLITPQFTKLQRVIPEIETEHEKAVMAKAALETSSILDNVEARIHARQKLREEEETAKKTELSGVESLCHVAQGISSSDDNDEEIAGYVENELGAPITADDELNDIESLFQEAMGVSSHNIEIDHTQDEGIEKERLPECTAVEVVNDEKKEAVLNVDQPIIESIISSFDDDDEEYHAYKKISPQERRTDEHRETMLQSIALPTTSDKDEKRLPGTHSTETSSAYCGGGGESIVSVLSNYSIAQKAIAEAARAELQRQKELVEYTERRQKYATSDASSAFTNDNLEEEIARLIAEKESRLQAERSVALMRAQRELEAERKARIQAEEARLKIEVELERIKSKEIPIVHEAPAVQECKSIPVQQDYEGVKDDLIAPNQHVDQDVEATHIEVEQEKPRPEDDSHHTPDDFSGVEKMISDAKAMKVTVEDDRLEINKLAVGTEAAAQPEQTDQKAIEKARTEAKASRLMAEKELERLRGERFSTKIDETARESVIVEDEVEIKQQSEDDVEMFRHGYSTDDVSQLRQRDSDEEKAPVENVKIHQASLRESNESGAMRSVESQSTYDFLGPDIMSTTPHNLGVEVGHAIDQGTSLMVEDDHENTPESDQHPAPATAQTDQLCDKAGPTMEDDFSSRSADEVSPPLVQESKTASNFSSNMLVEACDYEEAIIHHVARIAFEGNPAKGQLSFTTGSKIEAHSNQRGPWWLGRCGGRTGWFPASAIVPESEFLANIGTLTVLSGDPDASESVEPLSGDDLNAVYDLIRNPSDPLSQGGNDGDSDDESRSPAKSRWLDTEIGKNDSAVTSRDHSPPPTRLDPSKMAGLSERLYEPHDDDLHSNRGEEMPPFPVPEKNIVDKSGMPSKEVGETLSVEEMSNVELVDTKSDVADVDQPQSEICAMSNTQPKVEAKKAKQMPEWRATKDPNSGFIYYYHTGTRETTWEKPEGFVPKGASPKGQASTVSTKDKYTSRRKGIMGFITKITKGSSIASEKAVAQQTAANVDSGDKDYLHASELKPSAMTTVLRNDVKSVDDAISASDDESEMSRISEFTDTTLFSKQKIKATVGKWAEKVSDKISSPPDPAYVSLNDDAKQPLDATVVNQSEAEDVAACDGKHDGVKRLTSQNQEIIDTSKGAVNEEKPQWRSAVDEATGRTYYYIRGTSTVTWEKPTQYQICSM